MVIVQDREVSANIRLQTVKNAKFNLKILKFKKKRKYVRVFQEQEPNSNGPPE